MERARNRCFFLVLYEAPNRINYLLVCQAVENTIAPENDEIMICRNDSELGYLGLGGDYTFDAAKLVHFSLDVPDCPRD